MKYVFGILMLVMSLTVVQTGFATHSASEYYPAETHYAADRTRPQRPTSLPETKTFVPEVSLTNTNGGGRLFCDNVKRIAEKLSQPPTNLPPMIEARARQLVRLSEVVCNAQAQFVGFPDTGNRNEALIVNAYTVGRLLSSTATLIRQGVPGLDSDEAARRMMNRVRQNDMVWTETYRGQLATAYNQLSAADLSRAITDYQNWADSLIGFYRSDEM